MRIISRLRVQFTRWKMHLMLWLLVANSFDTSEIAYLQ
jgi:hypothetical protein